jgi:hypothetical protein
MVSLNKIINLGMAAAVIGGFFYLGGASGIGKHIGAGLTSFGSGLTSTLKFPTLSLPKLAETKPNGTEYDKAIEAAGGYDALTSSERVDIARKLLTPEEIEFGSIAKEFKPALTAGAISQSFAKQFSFQPPATGGSLDVSSTFGYLSEPISSKEIERRVASNFGGYGSAINQTTALAKAIETNAKLYPEWFA